MREGGTVREGREGIPRCDERETLFARRDLHHRFGPASDPFRDYYRLHPEHRAFDETIAASPPLGFTGADDAPMFDAAFDTIRKIAGESFVDGPPAEKRIDMTPERAAEKVKAFALHLGAKRAGAGPLRPEWTYSHVGRSFGDPEDFAPWGEPVDLSAHPHAVSFLVPMDETLLRSAPEFPVLLATSRAYADAAWIAVQLAEYIRGLGWSARAHHLYNYRALVVPVAVDCGLGELSRAGFLLNRDLGHGCRIGLVTTALPLAHDPPAGGGIRSFCRRCRICADRCPSGAIPKGEETLWNGVRKWKLDEERCYRYWFRNGTDCGICIATCPWTKPDNVLHRVLARFASIPGPHQRWMAWADRLFYGKHRPDRPPAYLDRREEGGGKKKGTARRAAFPAPSGGAIAASLAAFLLPGLWAAREWTAARGFSLGPAGWALAAAWLLWTGTGAAVVLLFASERAGRAARIAAALFGLPAAATLFLALRAAGAF